MSVELPFDALWVVIAAVTVSAYAFRLSFFVLFGRIDEIPPRVDRVLKYVAPAVLAALVLPKLVYVDGGVALMNPRLVAGGVAGLVAWRTENLAVTVVVGMAVFWGVRALL